MDYLLVTAVVVLSFSQNFFNKKYFNETGGNGAATFNLILVCASFATFACFSLFSFKFHAPTLLYSALFALCFACTIIFLVLSIKHGPLSMSALIISYSLIIPTVLGVIVLDEKIAAMGIIGMAFLVISLYLINSKKEKSNITAKWIIFISIAALGNGFCAFLQKMHQVKYPGAFRLEFMLFAMFMALIICFIYYRLTDYKNKTFTTKKPALFSALAGFANAFTNLLMLTLASVMPASILYPLVTGGGVVLTFIVSIAFFKEKLSFRQYAGSFIGLISIILLAI